MLTSYFLFRRTGTHTQTLCENIESVFPHLYKRAEIAWQGGSSFHYSERGKGAKLRFTQICKRVGKARAGERVKREEAFHLKHAKTT